MATYQSSDFSTSNSYLKYYIIITENSQSTANNTTSVTASFYAYRTNAYPTYADGSWVKGAINSVDYTGSFGSDKVVSTTPVLLYSKTQTISHNSDGTKRLTVSAQLYMPTGTPNITSSMNSFSVDLTPITRAATVTQTLSSKTETTIKMNWSASATCDRVYYSTNGGSTWSAAITVNASSGSYTISGLSSGTTYTVKTKVRRKDNSIESTSSSLSVKTYDLPTVSQSLDAKTEKTITMKWSSDSVCDRVRYSKDGGSTWSSMTVNASSGSYQITGLSVNTPYSIKTEVRRKSTGATNASSALSVTTYDWPQCTSAPSFVIGDKVTLTFYNPLGREITVYMRDKNNALVGNTNVIHGTSLSGFNGTAYTDDLYNSIPDDLSATYSVRVVYNDNGTNRTKTKTGGKYSVNESISSPVIGSVSYEDRRGTTTGLTGNNQIIVQNQSYVRFNATGLSARNGASIDPNDGAAMWVSFTGKELASAMTITGSTAESPQNYTIGALTNVRATFTLQDSRGLRTVYSIPITMLAYSDPSATIKAFRENGYYTSSYLTVSAQIAPLTVGGVDKNTLSIKYALQQEGSNSWSADTTISNNTQVSFSADNTTAWTIRVKLIDAIQTAQLFIVLPKGMPLIFFDRKRNSVGINCFPQHDNAFEVVPISGTYDPAISWGTSGGSGSPTLSTKNFYYAVTGNVMQISGVFQITTMGNSGNASLRIDLPSGYTCVLGASNANAPVGTLNPVTPASRPLIACARGSNYLYCVGGASAGSASSYMSTGYYMLNAVLLVNIT